MNCYICNKPAKMVIKFIILKDGPIMYGTTFDLCIKCSNMLQTQIENKNIKW